MSETQYQQPHHGGPPPARPTNVVAIVALIAGVIAFLTGLVPVLGLLLGIAAVVLGVLGLRKAKVLHGSGKGLAITGIVLGSIALLTSLLTTVLAGAIGASSSDTATSPAPVTSEEPAESAPAPGESTATTDAPPAESEAATATGQFPGQTEDDQVADAGATIDLDGLQVTTTPLTASSTALGSYWCTTATYVNGGDDSASYNLFDWNVLNPNGASESATLSGQDGALSSGELAPGGTVSGDVCFNDSSVAPGQNVVLYEVLSLFDSGRGAWLNTVS